MTINRLQRSLVFYLIAFSTVHASANRSPAIPIASPKLEAAVSEDIIDYVPKPMRRPNWAFSFLGAPFKDPSLGFQWDWQPSWIQDIGVLGIGAAVEYRSRWLVGGQARYQARFFSKQFLVPTGSFHYFSSFDQSYRESFPSVGLWLFLNSIDNTGAAQSFVNLGVLRTYFMLEHRWTNDSLWLLGLRTEF